MLQFVLCILLGIFLRTAKFHNINKQLWNVAIMFPFNFVEILFLCYYATSWQAANGIFIPNFIDLFHSILIMYELL